MTSPFSTSLSSLTQSTPNTQLSSSSHPPPPPQKHPMITRSQAGILKPRIPLSLIAYTGSSFEPHTFAQASKYPTWVDAMKQEYQALMDQQTWSLVTPSPTSKVIG